MFPPPRPCIFELQVPTTFPLEIFASSTKDKLVRATYHFSGPEQTEINNPASQDFHFYFIFSDFFFLTFEEMSGFQPTWLLCSFLSFRGTASETGILILECQSNDKYLNTKRRTRIWQALLTTKPLKNIADSFYFASKLCQLKVS